MNNVVKTSVAIVVLFRVRCRYDKMLKLIVSNGKLINVEATHWFRSEGSAP